MALSYSKVVIRGEQLLPFQTLLLTKDSSVADGYVGFEPGAKEGSVWTETNQSVTEKAYTGDAVSDDTTLAMVDNKIIYAKTVFEQIIKQTTLTDSIFAEDMGVGAEKVRSKTFEDLAGKSFAGAIANQQMINRWQGATAATKAAIALLVPGAGQGSISAATQAKVAALPVALRDGFFAAMVYNTWRANAVAGLGEYIKVDAGTITAANIAAEYAKVFAAIPADVLADTDKPVVICAPLAHRQLMRTANNSVGAASNQNFLFEGDAVDSKASYNGVPVCFVNLPANVLIAHPSKALFINADAVNADANFMEIGQQANGADHVYFKNVYSYAHAIQNQARNVLYS
jgi:hypothetical protein